MRALCENSVDEIDLAVMLEMTGVVDSTGAVRAGPVAVPQDPGAPPEGPSAASRNGQAAPHTARNVWLLVTDLRSRTSLRVNDPQETEPRAGGHAWIHAVLRGLMFAVPGVFYLAIGTATIGPRTLFVIVAAAAASWALSQAFSCFIFRVHADGSTDGAGRAVRRGLLLALPAAATALVAAGALTPPRVGVVVGAQILYALSATVLLHFRRDLHLAIALVPCALLGGYALFASSSAATANVAAVGVVVTTGGAWALAWIASAESPGRSPRAAVRRADVTATLWHGTYGVLGAISVGLIPAYRALGGDAGAVPVSDLTVVPLVLAMGFAEFELIRLNAACRRSAARLHGLAAYARAAALALGVSHLRVATVITVYSVAFAMIAIAYGWMSGDMVIRLAANAILGCGLIASLALSVFADIGTAVGGLVIGLVAAIAVDQALHAVGGPVDIYSRFLVGCVVLTCCITVRTFYAVRNPANLN